MWFITLVVDYNGCQMWGPEVNTWWSSLFLHDGGILASGVDMYLFQALELIKSTSVKVALEREWKLNSFYENRAVFSFRFLDIFLFRQIL
jgi:hypothetical protein